MGIMQNEAKVTIPFTVSTAAGGTFTTVKYYEIPGDFGWAGRIQAQLDAAAVTGSSLDTPICNIIIQTTHDPDVAYDAVEPTDGSPDTSGWHDTSFAFAQYATVTSDQIGAIVQGGAANETRFIGPRLRLRLTADAADANIGTYTGTIYLQLTR